MSAIETAASPRSLNRRLAVSSNRERICRPAVRVARTLCLGSLKRAFVEAPFIRPCSRKRMGVGRLSCLYVIQTNLSSRPSIPGIVEPNAFRKQGHKAAFGKSCRAARGMKPQTKSQLGFLKPARHIKSDQREGGGSRLDIENSAHHAGGAPNAGNDDAD